MICRTKPPKVPSLDRQILTKIGYQLRSYFDAGLSAPLPAAMHDALDRLEAKERA